MTTEKSNGRQQRTVQNLASALQECFDASIEVAERRMQRQVNDRVGAMQKCLETRIDSRADKQDETLRLIWRQVGGGADERLPIDG